MTESTKQPVSEGDVQQVAALANLELTIDELPTMRRDLNAILDYIAQLNELDTMAVAPMAQVSEIVDGDAIEGGESGSAGMPLREDKHVPGLERTAVLGTAPDTDGAFFKVPRVIER